jgi:hypothetical protein
MAPPPELCSRPKHVYRRPLTTTGAAAVIDSRNVEIANFRELGHVGMLGAAVNFRSIYGVIPAVVYERGLR